MILLDDYDSGYKLQGVLVVAEMLKRVPADLLKRTGVDKLVFSV
jgi:Tti2 family